MITLILLLKKSPQTPCFTRPVTAGSLLLFAFHSNFEVEWREA